jgi:hypothetical protein
MRRSVEKILVDSAGHYGPLKLGPYDELEMRADGRGNLIAVYITRVQLDERPSPAQFSQSK